MEEWVVNTFIRGLALGTPLLWAALGEIYAERSGVVNLGVEGMMILGAFSAFALAQPTANPLPGVLVWFVLYHTRWGIVIRSAGEAPAAVDTLGVNVALVRYLAVIFGGALAGGGGGFLSVGFPAALDRGDDQRPGVDRHRHRHLCLLGSPTGGRRRVPLRRALPPLVPPADLGGPGTAADDALCVYDSSIGADGTAWRAGAGRARGAGSAVRAWGEVTGGG